MGRESRKSERYYLSHLLRVFDLQNEKYIGYLQNISDEGILLIGEGSFEIDTKTKFKIDFPDGQDDMKNLVFEATSRWVRHGYLKGFVEVGYQFERIPEEATSEIDFLIKKFSFASLG